MAQSVPGVEAGCTLGRMPSNVTDSRHITSCFYLNSYYGGASSRTANKECLVSAYIRDQFLAVHDITCIQKVLFFAV